MFNVLMMQLSARVMQDMFNVLMMQLSARVM
jgi:hypothetical protein